MSLYHARSYHPKLISSKAYTKGNGLGNHNSEWVVYGKVKPAVTLTVHYILTEAARHPTVGRSLQETTLLMPEADEGLPRSLSKEKPFVVDQYLVDQVYACFMRAVLTQTAGPHMID